MMDKDYYERAIEAKNKVIEDKDREIEARKQFPNKDFISAYDHSQEIGTCLKHISKLQEEIERLRELIGKAYGEARDIDNAADAATKASQTLFEALKPSPASKPSDNPKTDDVKRILDYCASNFHGDLSNMFKALSTPNREAERNDLIEIINAKNCTIIDLERKIKDMQKVIKAAKELMLWTSIPPSFDQTTVSAWCDRQNKALKELKEALESLERGKEKS